MAQVSVGEPAEEGSLLSLGGLGAQTSNPCLSDHCCFGGPALNGPRGRLYTALRPCPPVATLKSVVTVAS